MKIKRFHLLLGVPLSLVLGGLSSTALAQVVQDRTLPSPSVVTSTQNRIVIRGGTRRGANLFHSFQEFSVPDGSTVSFQDVDPAVTNLFSRVTGSSTSRINGTIEVLQPNNRVSSANLFLLNPNGIIFGPRASLRVGGSFLATSANSIHFTDGTQFSAVAPQTTPLLTVTAPLGLQFGSRPGRIVNQSYQRTLDGQVYDSTGKPIYGLIVPAGHTLALVGGSIAIPTGRLVAEGGRIELGSIASPGLVSLTPIDQGWSLGYRGVEKFGDIRLSTGALIDTSGASGGAIQLQGRRISLSGFTTQVVSTTRGAQPGEPVNLAASDSVRVTGDSSSLRTETEGTGKAGDVNISTRRLMIREGGRIGSVTLGSGQGGDVRVTAPDSVTVRDTSEFGTLSVLYALTLGSGSGGRLFITTRQLQVLKGGNISTTTFDAGHAGDILIRAHEVNLAGIALDEQGNPIQQLQLPSVSTVVPYSSGLFVGTAPGSSGDGGTVKMNTHRLNIRDGSLLQASTYGRGSAGNLDIQVRDFINVEGTSENGQFHTSLAASSGGLPNAGSGRVESATGRGGDVTLTTRALTVRDEAVVAVNSLNRSAPGAGTLNVRQAQTLLLDRQGQLNAQTNSGSGAIIDLSQIGLLLLRDNSGISTSAGAGGGTGGNIRLDGNFIVAAPSGNSDITANAVQNNAGNVTINATVLGIAPQQRDTLQSDITATSDRGVSGQITISNLEVDPTRGLVELPTNVEDRSRWIVQSCPNRNESNASAASRFVITGRGGLPPSPTDVRSSDSLLTDWATLDPQIVSARQGTQEPEKQENVRANADPDQSAIVEAEGWILGADGKVRLIAQAPTATPHHSIFAAEGCDRS